MALAAMKARGAWAAPVAVNGAIKQSVSRWCYQKISLDKLSEFGASIGLKGIDLLPAEDFEVPKRYGLICTMGYAGGGEINKGLNRVENHADIEAGLVVRGRAGQDAAVLERELRAVPWADDGAVLQRAL